MTTPAPWHVTPPLWRAYAGGRLDWSAQSAVESHVAGCAHCQRGAAAYAGDPEPLWQAVHARITTPRPAWHLRALRRCGVAESDLVLVSAAGGLRIPWALAVSGALLTAVIVSALGSHQLAAYLFLAPLAPVLAVIGAYHATDELAGLVRTTPMSPLRLALSRAVAALAVAIPSALVIGALIPPLHPMLWLWLLPGLMLALAALVLLTRLSTQVAAAAVVGGWALVVAACTGTGTLRALAGVPGQTAAVAVCAALLVLFVRLSTTQPHGGPR